MPTTLADLLPPVTADEAKALLLETLQGIGPVQQVGNGAGVIVPSGSPANNYDVLITITTGGAPGAAAFQYSLDGGNTFNGPLAVPPSGLVSVVGGFALSFAGVFDAGDSYFFQTIYPPFPVTDWESGSGGRTLVEADAATLADLAGNALSGIASGGFVGTASGDWLSLLSAQLYENARNTQTPTIGLVQLILAASAPALTINPGDLVASNSPGTGAGVYQFSNTTGLTVTPGSTVSIPFEAQQPGAAFNLSNGVLTVLKTPKPGLTISNPAPGTSGVTHSGPGTGTVTPTGTPNGNYSVVVRITTSGGLGVGQAQISLDGGSNYASPFSIPATGGYPIPVLNGSQPTGITATFAGTFTAADTYSFTSYASWITNPGTDTETDPALQGRDISKWSAIGLGGGTAATFDYLARSTPNGGSEVTKTAVGPDSTSAGQIDLVVAGVNGPVSSSALTAITAYVKQYLGLCCALSVSNSADQTIPIVAQVFVRAAQQPAAQAAITQAFAELQAETPIGGTVYWSDLEAALNQKTSGVVQVFLTSPAPNTDTFLPPATVPLFDLSAVAYVLQ